MLILNIEFVKVEIEIIEICLIPHKSRSFEQFSYMLWFVEEGTTIGGFVPSNLVFDEGEYWQVGRECHQASGVVPPY
jgi:hypothetical protein